MKCNKQIVLGAWIVFFVTLVVFLPVLRGEFLSWDDNVLFQNNYHFRGFSSEHVTWMCTTFSYGHWQPISWVSYAVDYMLWGMNPHRWHVANWLLHALNGVLVYFLCLYFSGRKAWAASVLAALFFAIHPLRVEAVAWLSTRGYLLGGSFCLLTVLFYSPSVRRGRYPLASLFFFTLAALTKGICMMLPPVLLLLDWLVLSRVKSVRNGIVCCIEKSPFFLLSILAGGMAFLAKKNAGGMAGVNHYGLSERVVHAVYALWFYVYKSLFPQELSPLYCRRPEMFGVVLSFVLTALVAVLLFMFRKKTRPVSAAVGASLILIFPMIGIVQSGVQLFADRFTYLAAVPFSVLLSVLFFRIVRFRRMVWITVAILVFMFGGQASVWSRSWQNSLALWESALAVDQTCAIAYNNAGRALWDKGRYERSLEYFFKAIQLNPEYASAWHNRSLTLSILGEYETALEGWDVVFSLPAVSRHDRVRMLKVRGVVSEQSGSKDLALRDYTEIVNQKELDPDFRAGVLLLRAKLYLSEDLPEDAKRDAEQLLLLPDPFDKRHKDACRLIEAVDSRL